MSMEAQFYEARRLQNAIERRHSLRSQTEINKQSRLSEYPMLHIPVRVIRPENQPGRCTCIPMRRTKLANSDQSIYQRDRDIYPRPPPMPTRKRRYLRQGVLHKRFSSTEYLQQW